MNIVTVRESAAAPPKAANEGTRVEGDNVVRTGAKSRAALEFEDTSLARLGANTVFSFNSDKGSVDFEQGSALFSKPKNGQRLEIQTAAVTAAITGSTAFISVIKSATAQFKNVQDSDCPEETVLFGMLEGKMKGSAIWCNPRTGKAEQIKFRLDPGQMLVREPGKRPVVVQFDIPRFVRTSPLITDFAGELPNQLYINREIASYNTLVQRGFIEPTNVLVANLDNGLALGFETRNPAKYESGIQQLASIRQAAEMPRTISDLPQSMQSTPGGGPSGPFEPVGGNATIRGQLVWTNTADMDLHLILPDLQEVFFGNPLVTFNNGMATAKLDVDNLGGTINSPPNKRIENIIVTGTPSPGDYKFFFNNFFASPNAPDTGTLTVTGDGGATTQSVTGTVGQGGDSPTLIITVP